LVYTSFKKNSYIWTLLVYNVFIQAVNQKKLEKAEAQIQKKINKKTETKVVKKTIEKE
jgi:hypothetical protein